MDYIKLACLKCGQGNRVPNDKMYQGPKCASCGAGLMPSKVSELSPKIFEKAKNLDDALLVVDFGRLGVGRAKRWRQSLKRLHQDYQVRRDWPN